jgi:hypothetical protein
MIKFTASREEREKNEEEKLSMKREREGRKSKKKSVRKGWRGNNGRRDRERGMWREMAQMGMYGNVYGKRGVHL